MLLGDLLASASSDYETMMLKQIASRELFLIVQYAITSGASAAPAKFALLGAFQKVNATAGDIGSCSAAVLRIIVDYMQ